MKHPNQSRKEWQLNRERFHISDHFPPSPLREEKEIKTILSQILETEHPADKLPNALTDRWDILAGRQLAQHSTPVSLKKSTLYIHVDHPGWLTELRRLPKAPILKKISQIPGLPKINDLRFILNPAIRSWKNKP